MTDTTDDCQPTEFVYIGRAIAKDKQLCMKIIALDLLRKCETRQQAEQLSSLFPMKERELPHSIGFIYTIKARRDDAGVITLVRGRHEPMVDQNKHGINPEWFAHWQAIDRAEQVEKRARKLETKYDRDELRKRLAPLRHDFMATDKIGRLALEVVILDIIRNG